MFKDELALVTFKDWLADEIENKDRFLQDIELGVVVKLLRSEPYGEALAQVKRFLCEQIKDDEKKYTIDRDTAVALLVKIAEIEADIALTDFDEAEPAEELPFIGEDPEGDDEDEAEEVD